VVLPVTLLTLPTLTGRYFLILLLAAMLLPMLALGQGATMQEGRLILEEITIVGELRTPQALFLMLKSTPNLSNVLLDRSFLEDVVRPIYPGAFAAEPMFGAARESRVLPLWVRYGSVAILGGVSAWRYSAGDEEQGLVFGVMAGLDLIGNVILDFIGR
jgi:hypothetical protein